MQRKNKVLQYGLDRWYIGVNKSISVWTHHTRLERLVSTMKKHLTLDDRISIQEGLDQGLSLGKIAKSLDKATSTISREVNAHRVKAGRISERVKVPCSFRDTCKEYGIIIMAANSRLKSRECAANFFKLCYTQISVLVLLGRLPVSRFIKFIERIICLFLKHFFNFFTVRKVDHRLLFFIFRFFREAYKGL